MQYERFNRKGENEKMKLETIQESINNMIKDRRTADAQTMREVVAAIKKAAIDRQCNITEELVDEMLLKECKIIQEQIDTCPKEREELLETYKHKLLVVKRFAPTLIDDPVEITAMIEAVLAKAGIDPTTANKGQIMKVVMPALKGKVDMKIANQVISTYLK